MAGSTDPADPSNPNQNHTKSDGSKPDTAISAITDPDFLPTLDEAPATQHAKSHFLLLSMIVGGVFSAWFMGFDLFQVSEHQSWFVLALGLGSVAATGASKPLDDTFILRFSRASSSETSCGVLTLDYGHKSSFWLVEANADVQLQ